MPKLKLAFLSAVSGLLFLTACGELDTILPSSVSYQVSALVGNTPLDEYSVAGKNDPVQPVFINAVIKDPDLTGLLMYLRSPEGETVGDKVYYLLKTAKDTAEDEARDPVPGAGDTQEKEDHPEKTGVIESAVPAEQGEVLIPVSRLDKDLPAFPFPEDLEIGGYFLVFEVLGEKQTLYRTERHIYYIGDAKFSLDDIQSYLPGVSAGSFLIPPGLSVMLETRVAVDERLDPHIVWYNGKRRIAEGRILDGTSRLLWEAPAQTGFHTIRAELFPCKPGGVFSGTGNSRTRGRSSAQELRGKVKELILPVSAKGVQPEFFVPEAGEILHWYQLAGNLRDSLADGNRGRDLSGNTDLRWVPAEGIYGLSLKTGDVFQLPRLAFAMDEEKQGGGSFLLRVKPMAEGTLLTALFKAAASPENALTMSILYRERSLQLSLESGGVKTLSVLPLNIFSEEPSGDSEEISVDASSGASARPSPRGFILVEAGFYVRENTFTAVLRVEEGGKFRRETMLPGLFRTDFSAVPEAFPADSVKIELSGPLSGELSCKLGSSPEEAGPAARVLSEDPAPAGDLFPAETSGDRGSSQTGPGHLAIYDELALIFRNPARPSPK